MTQKIDVLFKAGHCTPLSDNVYVMDNPVNW